MNQAIMPYRLFIDDERYPVTPDWFVARKSWEASNAIEKYGIPTEIAFDHDLGGSDTAMHFIRWFENYLIDNEIILPHSFTYTVHSANPVGSASIISAMDQIVEHFKE